ncbi:ead/Ea22-like family protein [Klebsiella quasipneumoniae]|uniref:ead/Ea22-like family protein n=1 Tax=Klebsiella quasipneumoniae TaxID=1463165 RepID=UPI002405823A|nr:ead/Ea22-like family protein [Klebsiella quasipneumoniae]MDG0556538.1 ead/Ea22-like family protein [Klebsiella quasipneumoniae]
MKYKITELAQSLKAAAEKWQEAWGKYDKVEITIAEFIRAAEQYESIVKDPANVLALVEALESEKRICATWRKTAESTGEKLEKAQTINAAAEKLVRCKGRYHSEQNYRALAALFGVTTPDLPPLDSESSAVTVKLTDINEYLAEVHDKTLNRAFRLLAEGVRAGDVAAMRAAGLKVEAE